MVFLKKSRARLKRLRPFIIIASAALIYFLPVFGKIGSGPLENGEFERGEFYCAEDVKKFFPEADAFIPDGEIFRIKDVDGRLLGFAVCGPPEGTSIIGYAGEVPFLAVFDRGERIENVRLLESRETPGYARRVSEKLGGAWAGLSPAEAWRKPVDTVTGATRTSAALIEGVRLTMRDIAEDGRDFLPRSAVSGLGFIADALLLLYLAAGLTCYFFRFNSPAVKFLLAVFGVAVPGFFAASMLSLAVFESWLSGFFFLRRHWALIIVAFFSIMIPLIRGGNFYCFYFCPFGRAQDLVGKINKNKIKPGKNIYRFAGRLRIFLIAAAFAAIISGSGAKLYLFEPFSAFRWTYASLFPRALAAVFLFMALWIPRPWCRICPTGGVIDGLKKERM